jgi:hypothetical protein
MRHLKNRSLENCLISYRLIYLKLFHPEGRNFDWTDMRFLDTGISQTKFLILRFRDSRLPSFSISPMPDLCFGQIYNLCDTLGAAFVDKMRVFKYHPSPEFLKSFNEHSLFWKIFFLSYKHDKLTRFWFKKTFDMLI